jgi:hypothetical protein
VTPLNFVCKCRAPPAPRKHPAVFRKIRIEQIFSRAGICDLFFVRCRNADELRVFVTRRRLFFSLARAARSFACARFRSRESARSKRFTKAKFFCGEPPKKAFWRRFGTQNARIGAGDSLPRRRWRPSATPRGSREREIFAMLGAHAHLARRNFPHARAPTKVALRYRDAA